MPHPIEAIPATPEARLRAAVETDNIAQIRKLFHDYPMLDVNSRDQESGRAAAHIAAARQQKEILRILQTEYKADMTILDNEGFNVHELSVNPHPFDNILATNNNELKEIYSRVQFYINAFNQRYTESTDAKDNHLEMVDNTQQMVAFAKEHPELKQIGFIIKPPNCLKHLHISIAHLSAILYDRKNDTFIQLDTIGNPYIPPAKEGMKFYYSPLQIQVSRRGCAEAAILMMHEIMMKQVALTRFCEGHAVRQNMAPLSDAEIKQLTALYEKHGYKENYSGLTQDETEQKHHLENRNRIQPQLKVLQLSGCAPCTDIFQITAWPIELVPFLERFDHVRQFRTPQGLGNPNHYAILDRLIRAGTTRYKIDRQLIHTELLTDDEEKQIDTDFAGRSYPERHQSWIRAQHNSISLLFEHKLHQVSNKSDSTKNSPDSEARIKLSSEKIASFITGLAPRR